MDHSQRGSNNDSSAPTSASSGFMPNVLFREIHKNAFLKRHSSDRRAGFPRKSERVWVVFCVHDDVEPFLEIYPDQKVALTHKPEWFASLSNVLHVSPTICGHEDEFEFAVTLSFQVVRLSAPSWESMMEWVETIRNKLRELKVLCPKENIYSKMPEQKQPLLPTRDPNSPLPLPPEGPSTLLPGVEIVHLETRNGQATNENSEVSRHPRDAHSRSNNNNHDRRIPKRRDNLVDRDGRAVTDPSQSADPLNNFNSHSENHQSANMLEVSTSSVTTNCDVQPNRVKVKRAVSVPQPTPSTSNIPSSSNITVIEVSTSSTRENHSASECNPLIFDPPSDNEDSDDVFFAPNTQKPEAKNFSEVDNLDEVHYEHVFFSSPLVKSQAPQSSEGKIAVNCSPVDSKTYKKPHLTSVLINPNISNHINSSQDENVASTSSLCPSNNAPTKDVLPSNLTCLSISGKPEESEANGPLSPQIQSKLEKVNIPGLIPRVPAKSTKLGAFKPASCCNKDSNVSEAMKCSENRNQPATSSSGDQGIARMTNGESSKTNNPVAVSYSQVKKIPKTKVKSEGLRTEEEHPIPGSPVFSKRKVNEVQVVDVDSHRSKKPESLPSSSGSKPCLIDAKQKVSGGGKKSEAGNGSKEVAGNSETPTSSSSEHRNEVVGPSTSGNRIENSGRVNVTKKEPVVYSNNVPETVEPIIATVQPAVGVISVEDIPLIGGHQRRRRRSSSSDAAPASNIPPSRAISGADRIRINVPLTTNPGREGHRSEGETRSSSHTRNVPEQESHVNMASQSSRLTLREQQVLKLKKEMLHPGGVRLQLRRKDCTGSIALVDVLNGVWVAGWKQKEHPLLYNALHIGDQLIKVGSVMVRSSAEAHKWIRSSTGLYIEFIIRRVPFGNVFALHRSSEGQSLGIVQEGNTAEIKDVVPNSVAARQGLTSKTPSCDGLSLTTWFLTEINGRPLNLFFKDNEVRDRLNAVGKEISILVQPHDFIKQIKKQLKNLRSYKDYIVQ